MFKRVTIGSILCLALVVPTAAGHSHHHKTTTQVQLETVVPQGNGFSDFTGTVDSSKASCSGNRLLKVMFRKHGNDKVVGHGTSPAEIGGGPSSYDIVGRVAKTGHYYVLAPETAKCAAGQSNVFLLNAS